MAKRLWIACALFFLCAGAASAQDAKTVLQAAQKAMGDVTSIQYSGTGHINSFGQAWTPNAAWPSTNLTSYTKTIDYSSKSAKEDLIHSEPNPMVKGGGRPFAGDDKQANFVSGQYAWDMPGSTPVPQLGAAAERQLQIWLTPHGFLKAAMENNATAKKGAMGTEISFQTGKYTVTGTIDAHNMVTKTETWLPNPGPRRHARRNDVLGLQGFQWREVSDNDRAEAGRASRAGTDREQRESQSGPECFGAGRGEDRDGPAHQGAIAKDWLTESGLSPADRTTAWWWNFRPTSR